MLVGKRMELEDHHVKQNKSDSERQISYIFSHMQNLDLKTKQNKKEVMGMQKKHCLEGPVRQGR
jgi:hypothetical protein